MCGAALMAVALSGCQKDAEPAADNQAEPATKAGSVTTVATLGGSLATWEISWSNMPYTTSGQIQVYGFSGQYNVRNTSSQFFNWTAGIGSEIYSVYVGRDNMPTQLLMVCQGLSYGETGSYCGILTYNSQTPTPFWSPLTNGIHDYNIPMISTNSNTGDFTLTPPPSFSTTIPFPTHYKIKNMYGTLLQNTELAFNQQINVSVNLQYSPYMELSIPGLSSVPNFVLRSDWNGAYWTPFYTANVYP